MASKRTTPKRTTVLSGFSLLTAQSLTFVFDFLWFISSLMEVNHFIAVHSQQCWWPSSLFLCSLALPSAAYQPACLLTWNIAYKRMEGERWVCMGKEFHTHTTHAQNTTGLLHIMSTDHCLRPQARMLWEDETKMHGCKYTYTHTNTHLFKHRTHRHTQALVVLDRSSSSNLFFQLKPGPLHTEQLWL